MSELTKPFDIAVIGAGIAGASVAAELASSMRVILIERESQPGYHTTGRSAAIFSENYGPPTIRALSRASASFLHDPPSGFTGGPLLSARGVIMVARDDQTESLEAMLLEIGGNAGISRLSASDISLHVPILRDGYAKGAIFEETACDIDVHGLHHGYLRRLKADGGPIVTGCTVMGLSDDPGGWTIETSKGTIRAGMVVNAAGAWADEIAALAGAAPVGLMPRRRTAMIVEAHCDSYSPDWPMAADIDEDFYLKPESGRFLVSPADETLSPPCDAQPEEIDIAICIDRIETAFDLDIGAVESKWAGLRTFTADRVPVAGFDPRRPGFFWLAGQGGYGIQSAPALARFAAALALGGSSLPADIDVDPRNLDPGRFSAPPPDAANDKLQAEQANGR